MFHQLRPRLESPASIRRILALATLVAAAALVYASLVPLHFNSLDWSAAVARWRDIPWLRLDVYHRADWVANALVVLPVGMLAAAAVDWGRSTSGPLLVAAPLITLALALLVIAIELVQVWFPPRTVSLNDIAAGFVGAALGPPLWTLVGPFCQRAVSRFLTLPRFRDRLQVLLMLWLGAIFVYSVLPLDLVLSRAEWQERLASGRISWNPLAANMGARALLGDFLLAALRMGPIGMLLALRGRPREIRWGLWGLPVVLELIQLPFYSKHVTTLAIVGGIVGGWAGFWLVRQFDRLELLLRKPWVWAIGWLGAFGLIWGVLLGSAEHIETDPAVVAARQAKLWSLPLVNYYAGSEYSAYTVMFEKMALFGVLGLCTAGWQHTFAARRGGTIFWGATLLAICSALAIEWLQIYLPPTVPDLSDVLTYLVGYFAGYLGFQMLCGAAVPDSTSSAPLPGTR